jgi:hypothetical protein
MIVDRLARHKISDSENFRSSLHRLVRRWRVRALVASRLLYVFTQNFNSLVY